MNDSTTNNKSVLVSTTVCKSILPTVLAPDCAESRADEFALRMAQGLRDALVFSRLRAAGVAEMHLHATAMRLCRHVQFGRDVDGSLADFLGIERCGINGTRASQRLS